ncbi:MAG TPA: serine hydrolase domain-containing protein [Kineosporiaceae bacterium]|nr:serine hydrolase domain-containing protein [Kineosporiaceae bacterium]
MSRATAAGRIDAVLRSAVDSGTVPNVVAIAADRSGVIYQGAAGPRLAGGDDPVAVHSVFKIASMTKPVTTVAALQLFETGALDLDAPVEDYLPAFGNLQVLDGFDADGPVLRPPRSRATVRQLATHTTGLSYWFWNADLIRWEQLTGTPRATTGHSGAFGAPLVCDPGTRCEYGINADWLGRVVEAVSGVSLDVYIQEHITDPLGMGDTSFHPDDERRARLVPVHRGRPGCDWVPTELDWNRAPDWWSGGHGLYSTPLDYLRFQRALLGGGALGGVRILRPRTVEAAFSGQIGGLRFPAFIGTADPASSADARLGPGLTWGLGLLLTTRQAPGRRAAGSGSWAGIYNTHFWIDPRSGLTAALYTQLLPFLEPAAMALYVAFEEALYSARPALGTGSPR